MRHELGEPLRQQVKTLFRTLYDGLTALGICSGCKRRYALPGKVHCGTCRDKAEQKRRTAGMQPRTEKPPTEVSRQTREQRRNKAAGLCRQCRTPSPDRALCERCRERQKEQRLQRKAAKTP